MPTSRFSRNERREPDRWLVLDALAPAEATAAAVWERVARMLRRPEMGDGMGGGALDGERRGH